MAKSRAWAAALDPVRMHDRAFPHRLDDAYFSLSHKPWLAPQHHKI
jgi:hypothetical protein